MRHTPGDKHDPTVVVGGRIAQARKQRGLTQRQLAEGLGVTVRSVQSYESGAVLPYRHLARLGALLHRSPAWFLHGRTSGVEERDALVALRREFHDRFRTLDEQLGQLNERLEQLRGLAAQAGFPAPAPPGTEVDSVSGQAGAAFPELSSVVDLGGGGGFTSPRETGENAAAGAPTRLGSPRIRVAPVSAANEEPGGDAIES